MNKARAVSFGSFDATRRVESHWSVRKLAAGCVRGLDCCIVSVEGVNAGDWDECDDVLAVCASSPWCGLFPRFDVSPDSDVFAGTKPGVGIAVEEKTDTRRR